VALQMQRPLPWEAIEAADFVEVGVSPNLTELEAMPQKLVNTVVLYKAVKSVIENGGEMNL